MDDSTIEQLNAVNRRFYRVTAADFDQTRGYAWPGWVSVCDVLASPPRRVLDVACGNGRFGVYLAERYTAPVAYHGMDNNPQLLALAHDALHELPSLQVQLTERDVVLAPPDEGAYDLVVAFGLLHHIPGAANRQAFVRSLARRVAPGGVLAFAGWRFYAFERFRQRIIPWAEPLASQVERHDYLLDWRRGANALRYCHYVDDDELATLIDASGLTPLTTFRADGKTGDMNAYALLANPAGTNGIIQDE
jgi:tRNA (uracil-5-)-methyltransferase TRM9